MTWGGARGGVALVGIALLLVGTIAGFGLLPFSVVPVSSTSGPTFHMQEHVSASGFNVTTAVKFVLEPQPAMTLQTLTINWGGNVVVYHPPGVSGYYTVTRSYTFSLAGTYTIQASGVAKDNGVIYTATSPPAKSTVPGTPGNGGGCINLCVEVDSAFIVTTNGLTATFTDQSKAFNATTTTIAWSFGDGTCTSNPSLPVCMGTTTTHTYAAAGTYLVSENVTAQNVTGAVAYATSSQNITVSTLTTSCGGTGSCSTPAPSFLTPTSGLFIGLGIGLLVVAVVAVLFRLDIAILVIVIGGVAGFVVGLVATGSWGL